MNKRVVLTIIGVCALATILTACGFPMTAKAPARMTVTATVTANATSTVTETVSATAPQTNKPTRAESAGTSIPGDGTFLVGTDFEPGTYRSPGGQDGLNCWWKRLSSINTDDVIDEGFSEGPQLVEILPSDKAFNTDQCLTWQKMK